MSSAMYSEDRTQVFIDSLAPALPGFFEELRVYAAAHCVPVIRRQSEPLLRFFMASLKPSRILEIGTAIGYSAMFMCYSATGSVSIDTIERSPDWSQLAGDNFRKYGYADRIHLIAGDAGDILPTLDGSYDMVFMDAAKGQYLNFLPDVTRLLRKGGILISDNVLMDGDIIKPRSLIHRRDRTIHSRMRDYLYEITHSDIYQTLVLPLADGTAVSVRV